MNPGEWLTRGTVWLALSLYAGGELARSGERRHLPATASRWWHTSGCLAFLAHVLCAFHFYHAWSHAAAYADTARQTQAMFGWRSGGGLYVNYAFALVWLGEVLWSWIDDRGYRARPRWLTGAWRGFFLFMIFNGAVVFARGPVRWFGLGLCLVLLAAWWRGRSRCAGPPAPTDPA